MYCVNSARGTFRATARKAPHLAYVCQIFLTTMPANRSPGLEESRRVEGNRQATNSLISPYLVAQGTVRLEIMRIAKPIVSVHVPAGKRLTAEDLEKLPKIDFLLVSGGDKYVLHGDDTPGKEKCRLLRLVGFPVMTKNADGTVCVMYDLETTSCADESHAGGDYACTDVSIHRSPSVYDCICRNRRAQWRNVHVVVIRGDGGHRVCAGSWSTRAPCPDAFGWRLHAHTPWP